MKSLSAKRTYRQRKFAKMLRKEPVIIAASSEGCRVSNPFHPDRAADLLAAEDGADFGGFSSGGLPETNRRKF